MRIGQRKIIHKYWLYDFITSKINDSGKEFAFTTIPAEIFKWKKKLNSPVITKWTMRILISVSSLKIQQRSAILKKEFHIRIAQSNMI